MPVYTIEFRNCPSPIEEDFRDLEMAISEGMRRARDIAEIENREALHDDWVARVREGGRLAHEVKLRDLASPQHHEASFMPPEGSSALEEGLEDSFPASDPPAAVSPTVATREK